MKKHNFNAGPCVLPREAVESAIEAIRDFDNTGIGLLEISHRTPGWERIMAETEQLWRDLLNIPDDYAVMFLGGGASTQFFEVPANLLKKKAAYLQTGVWAKKAAKEAKFYGEVEIVASSEDKNYTVADMSSDIMSRPVDVKYGMIYGGAQKNVGPAGVTFVIIRKDLIGSSERPLQTMVNYATHYPEEARNHSMFNTPPVLPIFVMHETLKWVKAQGGVEAMYKINKKKAETLYNEIDRNSMFVGTAVKEDRSMMNVCFVMAPGHEDLEAEFMAFAKEKGMVGIKGHRSVGGFRASIYNACPQESVDALVACMQEFEKNHKK